MRIDSKAINGYALKKGKRALAAGVAIGALTLATAPAWAQTAGQASDKDSAATSQQILTTGDIVVTARRQSEALSKVPVAVTAFTQQALTSRQISNVFDLNKAVPGLAVQANSGNTGSPNFAIRGRGQNYGTASGSVETYFAEVPLSSPFLEPGLPVQFFDLSSFQVLKGPQGTLFGRNTTGGAVLVVPAAPTDKFEGYVRGQVGTFNDRQFEGAINIPILDDRVDLRVAAYHWHRDGYGHTAGGQADDVTGQILPSQSFYNQNTTEARATLLIRPVDGLESSTIFTYHYDKVRIGQNPGLYADPFGIGVPNGSTFVRTEPASGTNIYKPPYYGTYRAESGVNLEKPGNHSWGVINKTRYELNDAIALQNIFGYIESHGYTFAGQDQDGTTLPLSDELLPARRNVNRQLTDEVQLQGKSLGGRLNWTVGALYDQTREPGGNNRNFADASYSLFAFTTTFEQQQFTSYSLFGSGSYAVTGALNLTFGYRHTWDHISDNVVAVNDFVATPDSPLALPEIRARHNFQGNTYNIGLDWHPDSTSMIYGGYRHGYKRGGFSSSALAFSPAGSGNGSFKPENVDDFNLGFKKDFRAGGMRGHFAIEGFYDFYKDEQVTYASLIGPAPVAVTTNVPKTEFRGFELDGQLEPTKWLSWTAAFSFTDAKNTKWNDDSVPGLTQDLTVNPVAFISKYKLSSTLRLHQVVSSRGDEISLAPSINYQSKFYTGPYAKLLTLGTQINILGSNFDQEALGASQVPKYTTFDLRAEWNHIRGSRVSIAANVTNLTNKYYLYYANPIMYLYSSAWTVGPPRMATFDLRVDF